MGAMRSIARAAIQFTVQPHPNPSPEGEGLENPNSQLCSLRLDPRVRANCGRQQAPKRGEYSREGLKVKSVMLLAMGVALATLSGASLAQNAPPAPAPRAGGPPPAAVLGDGPWDIKTEKASVHVEVVTKGLNTPWALAFLPDGTMLVTERGGQLRVIKDGVLDPTPVAGVPPLVPGGLGGLMDIALHPQFKKNHLIYMSYTKGDGTPKGNTTTAVMRARWDGSGTLKDVKDIFVADAWYGKAPLLVRCCGQGPATGSYGSRIAFDKAGYLFVTVGDRNFGEMAQNPSTDIGKIVRLKDDGSIPKDNPFVGKKGYLPEIWTVGHRNPLGLVFHPVTGALWESEFGPQGGDEVNIIAKGKNYGWMYITNGRHYNGAANKLGKNGVAGYEDPVLHWEPSINPGNLTFTYSDKFPAWKGDMLVPTMTRSVLRATFDANGRPTGQERMLGELKQRFRDIRMGPDGYIYILTDEAKGALLRVKPGA